MFSFLDLNGAEILIATAMPIFVPFYFDLFVLHFWNDLRNGSKKVFFWDETKFLSEHVLSKWAASLKAGIQLLYTANKY